MIGVGWKAGKLLRATTAYLLELPLREEGVCTRHLETPSSEKERLLALLSFAVFADEAGKTFFAGAWQAPPTASTSLCRDFTVPVHRRYAEVREGLFGSCVP